MIKKIVLTFLPIQFWITLSVALFLFILGDKHLPFVYILCNAVLFLAGVKIAVLLHEVGHLLFAKIAGGSPRRMVLGKGHKVAQAKYKGVKIILNSNLNSGLAYAAFDNLNYIRWKLFFYISGGFVINFIIAGTFFIFFGISIDISDGILFSSSIIISHFLAGVSALIPYRSNYQGLKLNSDGLSILKIPFYKKPDLLRLTSVNDLLDAYDFLEEKQYKKAIYIYENHKSDKASILNLNLGIAYIKIGDYEKARELIETLIPSIQDGIQKKYESYIYNGLAWVYLLLNRLEDAEKYSKLAFQAGATIENIRGTRGSVLIEMGKIEEGKEILIDQVDFNFPNSQTLVASMYLSWAFHQLKKTKKAKKYWNFVVGNVDLLEPDEKVLYVRISEKIDQLLNQTIS